MPKRQAAGDGVDLGADGLRGAGAVVEGPAGAAGRGTPGSVGDRDEHGADGNDRDARPPGATERGARFARSCCPPGCVVLVGCFATVRDETYRRYTTCYPWWHRSRPGLPRFDIQAPHSPCGASAVGSLRGPLLSSLAHADVAQLVEHNLAKVGVAGSNPVVRSIDRLERARRSALFGSVPPWSLVALSGEPGARHG